MKMIPATHDYYKLAPLLFALSKDKGIFASAAGELLRILTNEEVRVLSMWHPWWTTNKSFLSTHN